MPTILPTDIDLDGLNFTRAQEGRALRAYQDSVGVWTVGYGLTHFDKGLPWKVEKGLTITEQQAEWYLLKSIRENYLPTVRRVLNGGTYDHPQGVINGGNDFHFNCGGITKATWPAALGRGDLAAAKSSLESWNKAGGRVLSGLTRRRAGNWLEVSAGKYGHLSGPDIIELTASDHERSGGVGDVLAAFPTDPGDTFAGSVKTTGVPQPTTEAPGVLKSGVAGPAVTDLQNSLTAAGYPTPATGTFDAATSASVIAFQQSHPNLTADGKVGPATRATIARAIAMRDAAGKIIKTTTPLAPGAYITFHQWVSAHAGNIALGVVLTAAAAVAAYYLWQHRHDAHGWINGVIGRVVP